MAEWDDPAAAGDPDAMFNLAQAYRLGRGVAKDPARAEQLYARAAQAGHMQAADTYGLMLFQDGRREQALPLVTDAARRGDPRSQYLLGIAHFNGDIVQRDWVRAYALLTLANSEGLPQAAPALAQMDGFIPLPQRQQAARLASQLRAEAETARSVELAAADLGMQAREDAIPRPTSRVPRPIATTAVSPSIAAAQSAIAEARRATGTETPAEAGADFARANAVSSAAPRVTGAVQAAPRAPATTAARAEVPAAVARDPAPARENFASGPWRVQLGAFSVAGNAERLWSRLSDRAEIAGRQRVLVPAGRVTKLQAGGYASRNDAQEACNSLKRAGQDCLVTRN